MDAEARLAEDIKGYQDAILGLHDQIRAWVEDTPITLTKHPERLTEDGHLVETFATILSIPGKAQTLAFRPYAVRIVAGKGRVEVTGIPYTAYLIRRSPDGQWLLITQRPVNAAKERPFDSEALFSLVNDVR